MKEYLLSLPPLPKNARIFTADAISMYTNIDTEDALPKLHKKLLREYKLDPSKHEIHPKLVHKALTLIMKNNVFQFGDTFWFQLTGCAMGTPPACAYATLYFADHEEQALKLFPELHVLRRYIDDLIGIWIPKDNNDESTDNQRWRLYKQYMDTCGSLRWEFSNRTMSVDFLDLTITINKNGKIQTKLYEKAMNLYLYLPPSTSHPTSIIKGFIYGLILRIYRLTSEVVHIKNDLKKLYKRLVARGYKYDFLTPIFEKAFMKIHSTIVPNNTNTDIQRPVMLHLQYHPNDPPSKTIQKLFDKYIHHPISTTDVFPLPDIKNFNSIAIGINRLIVAYSRPNNLGNKLSSRIINEQNGLRVSSFL